MKKKQLFFSEISIIRIMKIYLVLLCITVTNIFATEVYSQSITLNAENVKIKKILTEIESKSDFSFFYNSSIVNVGLKKSLTVEDIKIDDVLNLLFNDTNIDYSFIRNQIILYPKGKPELKLKIERLLDRTETTIVSSLTPKMVDEYIQSILQTKITGKVIDENGVPLAGVTVLIKNASKGTTTDFDGNYTLDVESSDAILIFSYVGFTTQEIALNDKTVVNVTMAEDRAELDEVIIVGYGTQKKVNLTGAVSTIKADAFENRPITSATQLLAGMASGVHVSQTSGRPGGDDASIRIRGTGTLGNSNALVLVDGLTGALSDVNPSDIESVTVLKDAASTSIYGARAANGVILVTTKKGKSGKLKVSYDFYTGVQQATALTDYVTNSADFMEFFNQTLINENPTASPVYSQTDIDAFRNGTNPYIYPNTDWNDIMYRSASISSHNLRVGGGTENTSYSFSLGYVDQEGVLLGTDNTNYNARLNLDSKFSDKFKYSVKISARHDDTNEPVAGSSTVTGWVNRALPHNGVYTEDGRYASGWVGSSSQNAVAGALEGKNLKAEENLVFNLSGVYEIIDGLEFTGTVGVNKYSYLQKIFRPEILVYNPVSLASTSQGSGGASLSADNRYYQDVDLTFMSNLNYKRTFADKHNTSFLVGFQQETSDVDYLRGTKDGIPSNLLQEIDAGTVDPTASGYHVDFGLQSFFGRVNYNYDEKYLFEANFRYDGSSNFAEGNKWGFFPSLSAGWNVSKESFLADSNFISDLKFRASWGQLGNQSISPNQYSATYGLSGTYSYGGSLAGGAAQTSLPNPDVTWETSTQTDIGIDASLLGNKLGVVIDYFDRTTDDILQAVSISNVIGGLNPPTVNLASVRNKGWEIALNYKNSIGELSYHAGFNFTAVDNEVTKIPAPAISGMTRIQEGSPINEYFVIKAIGIFQTPEDVTAHGAQPTAKPGDVKFEDFDGDGEIDGDDRQALGSSLPKSTWGLSLGADYKGFDFSALVQGVDGVLAVTEHEQKPFFNGAGLPQYWADNAWTNENRSTTTPRLTRSSVYTANTWRDSSFLLEDASFIRIKNIQLGYSFSKEVLDKLKLDRLRLYLNAQNPLTITDYRGIDPEKNVRAGRGSYTNVSIYSFGINISL